MIKISSSTLIIRSLLELITGTPWSDSIGTVEELPTNKPPFVIKSPLALMLPEAVICPCGVIETKLALREFE